MSGQFSVFISLREMKCPPCTAPVTTPTVARKATMALNASRSNSQDTIPVQMNSSTRNVQMCCAVILMVP